MILREYLKENRITVKDFAKKLNVSRQHLNRVVCGTYKPGKTLAKLIELETNGLVTIADYDKPQEYFDIHKG